MQLTYLGKNTIIMTSAICLNYSVNFSSQHSNDNTAIYVGTYCHVS